MSYFLIVSLAWMLLLSLIAYAIMAWDKRQARLNRARIAESGLHTLALLGGWPGSLLASRHLRHKTRKQRFQIIRTCCIILNITALSLLAWLTYR